MRSRTHGPVVILIVAVLGFSAGLALSSCGGEDEATPPVTTTTETQTTNETTSTDTTPTLVVNQTIVDIRVLNGVPVGGIERVTVDNGDLVSIYVESDVADDVHVHGYDVSRAVAPGKRAVLEFRATIPGRFEVELEDRGVPIAELTVNP